MTQNDVAGAAATTTALRALGTAIFGLVAVLVGFLLRWLIHLDGSFDPSNEQFAHFLIGVGALVALPALLVVAKELVTLPRVP